ncbi:carbohydrate porin [uncultured Sphingomonas sp.]|uniref:carbohydrate porin n=1 Tax=uncultured Sphingomonas sp. TaxID=158754 RepID=UPI0025DAAB9C|nr:carbohydrate porin [uncultured Sphingomonas sp.]
MVRTISLLASACALAGLPLHAPAKAQDIQERAPALIVPAATVPPEVVPADQRVAFHGQATFVLQGTPGFASPYSGTNSLTPRQARETVDVTLYAGLRPWAGGELWVNPEIDQGFGLSNTLGVAGFSSAEAYKVGRTSPYSRLQRLFLRQTIGLGGEREAVAGVANQLAGSRMSDHMVLTAGKFGVGDVFDTNSYAHDPRADFLNWSAVDAGSFDYAADAWGYTTGVAAEWYQGVWTLRLGAFNLSKVPNGESLETGFQQYQLDGEVERRHMLAGRPGAVRVTIFRNRGRFGRFDEALELSGLTGNDADTALVRRRRTRAGISVNAEQAVTDKLGVFGRAGIADGQVEPYDFTDIDHTAQLGLALKGAGWGREGDTVGAVFIVNGISREHQRYLDAGGLGVLVGDGRLPHPGSEYIGEAYYKLVAVKGAEFSLDYQFVANPGYNRDRGPANVFAFRAHGAF